jgi:hypothetical protein
MKNFQTRSPLPRSCWYSPLARGLALRPSGPVMYARLLAALVLAGAFASQSASAREHLHWPMRRTTAECRAEAGSCRIAQIRRNCSFDHWLRTGRSRGGALRLLPKVSVRGSDRKRDRNSSQQCRQRTTSSPPARRSCRGPRAA